MTGLLVPGLVRFVWTAIRLAAAFAAVSLFLFLAIRALPGDPVALRLKNPSPAQVAAERERLGLDRSAAVQYVRYLGHFVSGDWGESVRTGAPVVRDVRQFLPATLELALTALVLGVTGGVVLGLLAEAARAAWLKRTVFALGMVGLTVPIFWIGFLFLLAGSLWLGWFPPGGRAGPGIEAPAGTGFLVPDLLLAGRWGDAGNALRHLLLPSFCLSLLPAAQVCTTLRARLQDPRVGALLTALRARGLSPAAIWLRHVLKLSAGPVVTVAGTNFGILLGGAVLTETVFSWPGMGRYLVGAVLERDIYVVQNALLLVIMMVLTIVYTSDQLAGWLRQPAGSAGRERDRGGAG